MNGKHYQFMEQSTCFGLQLVNKWVALIYVCKILFQIPPTKSNFGNQTPYQ
jgi:hypothetical protein